MFELHWYGYNPFSPFLAFSWLWFFLTIGILIFPVARILGRLRFSPLWALLAFVPFVNPIGLWTLAWRNGRQGRHRPNIRRGDAGCRAIEPVALAAFEQKFRAANI